MSTPNDKALTPVEQAITDQGVFKGAHGLKGLLDADAFWETMPYGTRLYYGDGAADYLHRDVLRSAIVALASLKSVDDDRAKLIAERDELVEKAKEAEEYLVMALGSDAFVRTPDPIQRWILKARALLSKYKTE